MSKKGTIPDSALQVRQGVSAPGQFNPGIGKFFHRRPLPDTETVLQGIRQGDRVMLGRAITLVESRLSQQQAIARDLIERCTPLSGNALRIGITGSPGVGKSSFIEAFGKILVAQGHRLAVLAIDPSSQMSKGSILGDKTRMHDLATLEEVFIRPSPSGGSIGGVARKTRETVVLCEAAGFDIIIIETVGVGQSEIAVHSMVDYFLLLLLPGAGDELQGIKRGIVEMADGLAVNKADGENLQRARQAMAEYAAALHFFPPRSGGWSPSVQLCSATNGTGISEIWQKIRDFEAHARSNGSFEDKRRGQARYWMYETINDLLKNAFFEHPDVKTALGLTEAQVLGGQLSPFHAAERLIDYFLHRPDGK